MGFNKIVEIVELHNLTSFETKMFSKIIHHVAMRGFIHSKHSFLESPILEL
jgi:hypothetical protein